MLNILMTFAQFEREMIATRIKDKMSATRKKGKYTGGVSPFGYIAFEKRLIVDENEAPTVRRIFKRYLEIQSPKQIAYELNQDGLKTGTGKEWDTARIYRILNNYTYAGKVFYEGHAYPGEHEAIIDDKTWRLTQSFLKANTPNPKPTERRKSSSAALSGVIRCGHCNSAMGPARSSRWGRVYHYYHCLRDSKRDVSICPVKLIPAGEIEALVCQEVTPILKSPEVIAAVSRQTGIRPKEVGNILDDSFWAELTPVEKQSLFRILVEHVTVNEDGAVIELRTENIKSIQEAYNDPQDS